MTTPKLLLPEPEPQYITSVNVRLTAAQKKQITEAAQKYKVSASELMRHFTFQALDQLSNDSNEETLESE